MGAKGSKTKLSSKDMKFLKTHTGLPEAEINGVFSRFIANNPDGKLDRNEFKSLYDQLKSVPYQDINGIVELAFKEFDKDNNGFISFNEFLVAYAMTSKGDLRKKIDFTFDVYDQDNNGYLDANELRSGLTAMLRLVYAQCDDIQGLVNVFIDMLDVNNDNKVTKDEFVRGLTSNTTLMDLLDPFK